MKIKAFFINFQGLKIVSDLRLCLQLYWLLKEDFCVILQKRLGAVILWHKVARVSNFQLLLNSKSSKISLYSFLKNISKIHISDLRKRVFFFKFYSKGCYFSITRLDILIFCNIIHTLKWFLEFVLKSESFFIKFLT